MIHFISNAQSPFNCDINVPSNQVNFLDTYSSAIINFTTVNQGAGYQCCSQPANMTCETFTVNTFASNIAFNITTGQNFNGNSIVIHVNNCSTPINVGEYFCVTGGYFYEVSVCTDATNPFTLFFNAIGAPVIDGQFDVTNGCNSGIAIYGLEPGTINVNSTSPGNAGDYNGLFDCSSSCQEFITFEPTTDNPVSIGYEICGDVLAPACIDPDLYCGNITFNIAPSITVTGLENDIDICEGANFPPIEATVTGGAQPYTYNWSGPEIDPMNPPNSNTITVSTPGTYELTVYDANGCASGPHNITLTETPLPTVNAELDQNFCTPQSPINVSGSAGMGTSISWSGAGSFNNPNFPNTNYIPTLAEMGAGTFTLTLNGSNTCGSVSDNVNITFNTANGITLTESITDITCFGASTGAISLTVNNGSGNYSYSWSNSANTASITNLPAGLYTVTVTDITYGCTAFGTYNVIHLNDPPPFTVNLLGTNPSCSNANDGDVSSTLNGGTFPFTYTWANGLGSSPFLTNLGAGTYTLNVLDNNGCLATSTVTLTAPDPLVIIETVNNISCNGLDNGSITTLVTGGTQGYNYSWAPNGETTTGLSGLSAGSYSLTVTDVNLCAVTETSDYRDWETDRKSTRLNSSH